MRRTIAYATLAAVAGLVILAALDATADPRRPVLITGEVIAVNSQDILMPATNGGPALLRNFVPEGTEVKKGDLVLRIDATVSEDVSITQLQAELAQVQARAQREWSDLAVKAIDAEKELRAAAAALKKAGIDAALPRTLVPGLDYDRYQGELVRTRRELEVKQQALANAKAAVQRRRADGDLEASKLRFNLEFTKALQTAAEVRAERDGAVVHAYSTWRGERFDEGSSAHPGTTVGHIVGTGRKQVRAWALEADRPFLAAQQSVALSFDALPELRLVGSIERIAGAPQQRPAWGNGRYFQVDISLPEDSAAQLVPGMSALVEPLASESARAHPTARATSLAPPKVLQLEGEIASRTAIAISPPKVPEVWMYNLVTLPPEGSVIRAGEPAAVFDAASLRPGLDSKQSMLKEKLRALDKLELDHREASRAAAIDVAEANSNLEKAQRKVSQPREQIRRIDYDKLVIDSELAQELAKLAQAQLAARAEARTAERAELEAAIAQLRREIAQLEAGIASLTIVARQTGLLLYRLQFNGEKFAVGNQVYRGISVATLADPSQLMVRAVVPEAQAAAVRLGQRGRVNVPGANLALGAKVTGLGRIYHIKSKAQPVIVRDVELQFDVMPKGLKPGAAVQIALTTGAPATQTLGESSAGASTRTVAAEGGTANAL